ncbi:hypothetical protein VTK26DRAFT_6464 [Humicola hyalothermophila]
MPLDGSGRGQLSQREVFSSNRTVAAEVVKLGGCCRSFHRDAFPTLVAYPPWLPRPISAVARAERQGPSGTIVVSETGLLSMLYSSSVERELPLQEPATAQGKPVRRIFVRQRSRRSMSNGVSFYPRQRKLESYM